MIILNIRFLLHAEGSAAHMLFYLSVGGSDFADNFYFIHIPGDRNLCQYTGGTLQKCVSAGIYAFPHNDRHCGDHDLSIVYDISRCKATATLRMLLVFLWIRTCSFYKLMLLYRFLRSCFLRRRIFRFCDEKLGKIVIYLDIVFLDIVFSLFKAEEICEGESTQSCEARFSPRAPLSGHAIVVRCPTLSSKQPAHHSHQEPHSGHHSVHHPQSLQG